MSTVLQNEAEKFVAVDACTVYIDYGQFVLIIHAGALSVTVRKDTLEPVGLPLSSLPFQAIYPLRRIRNRPANGRTVYPDPAHGIVANRKSEHGTQNTKEVNNEWESSSGLIRSFYLYLLAAKPFQDQR